MKTVASTVLVAFFATFAGAEDKKEVGAYLINTTPEEIAKEFKADPARAKQKFNPNPPQKGTMGGAIVSIKGEPTGTSAEAVFFKSVDGLEIAVFATGIPKDRTGRWVVEISNARFNTFQGNFVVFKDGEAKFIRVIGEKK